MSPSCETLQLDGHDIAFKRADKVLFPDCGFTKRDVLDHYLRAAPLMLPFLKGRALTLKRFPDGIGKAGFYQKSAPDYAPDWLKTASVKKRDGSRIDMVCANNRAALAWLAGQGVIVFHAPLARADRPDRPDQMIFDLDPTEDFTPAVRRAALTLNDILDECGLRSFVKTTGSRGYHIVVPLRRDHDFDAVKAEAKRIACALCDAMPDETTIEVRKAKRQGRIFIDTLRNETAQTAVAPYSLRAREGAPVAVPLSWTQLRRDTVHPRQYTLKNLSRRLGQVDDPWADFFNSGNALSLSG